MPYIVSNPFLHCFKNVEVLQIVTGVHKGWTVSAPQHSASVGKVRISTWRTDPCSPHIVYSLLFGINRV